MKNLIIILTMITFMVFSAPIMSAELTTIDKDGKFATSFPVEIKIISPDKGEIFLSELKFTPEGLNSCLQKDWRSQKAGDCQQTSWKKIQENGVEEDLEIYIKWFENEPFNKINFIEFVKKFNYI